MPRSISYARLEQGEMEQFHGAAVMALRQRQVGARLRQFRARHGVIQAYQELALLDGLAFLEFDGLDAAGHFRPQDDRLIGPQAADGRQPAREGDFLDGCNGHPGRGGGSGFGDGLGGRGRRRQPARHKNAERGPRGQPCRNRGQQYCFFHARMWR